MLKSFIRATVLLGFVFSISSFAQTLILSPSPAKDGLALALEEASPLYKFKIHTTRLTTTNSGDEYILELYPVDPGNNAIAAAIPPINFGRDLAYAMAVESAFLKGMIHSISSNYADGAVPAELLPKDLWVTFSNAKIKFEDSYLDSPDTRQLLLKKALSPAALALAKPLPFRTEKTESTPYDQYIAHKLKQNVFDKDTTNACSLDVVRDLMRTARAFEYFHEEPYIPNDPEVVSEKHRGDCKDKALWLASKLRTTALLFVIGKMQVGSKTSHAWLYAYCENKWWLLDPTMLNRPIGLSEVSQSKSSYLPLYIYAANATYVAPQNLVPDEIPGLRAVGQ